MASKGKSVEVSPDPKAGITSIPKSVGTRLHNVENLTNAVLFIGVISLLAIIVSVSAMVIDQFHFNNQTYRDQSDKTNLQMQELNLRIDALEQQIKNNGATK